MTILFAFVVLALFCFASAMLACGLVYLGEKLFWRLLAWIIWTFEIEFKR